MKKRYRILLLTVVTLITTAGYAALTHTVLRANGDDDKKKKQVIEKKIEITEENGIKKVTVTTTHDGKTQTETYSGQAAEEYLEKNNKVLWQGSGQGAFQFRMDGDSAGSFSMHDFSTIPDSVWLQIEKEMKEAMEHLKQSGLEIKLQMNGMHLNFDSLINLGHGFRYYPNPDPSGMDRQPDSLFKNMEIQIDIHGNEKPEPNGIHKLPHNRVKKIVVSRSVEVTDMEQEGKRSRTPEVEEIAFYPNPSEGDFTVRYNSLKESPVRISVTDVTGREIYAETVSGIGVMKRQVSLGNQPAGSYLLILQQGKSAIRKKLIIH